ncbi:MAG: hypothetical protein E7484_01835 [Ruminococcaceae bacterium]|nr:hypothetical protein [Oscillospiraceae bacterium]
MAFEDYKKQAADDLRNLPHLKARAENLKRQINMLTEMDVQSVEIFDRVFEQANSDHYSRLAVLQKEFNLVTFRILCTENALNSLTAADKDILISFYVARQRNTVNNLARKTYTDRSCLYRRAQKALEKYIYTCYGVHKDI